VGVVAVVKLVGVVVFVVVVIIVAVVVAVVVVVVAGGQYILLHLVPDESSICKPLDPML